MTLIIGCTEDIDESTTQTDSKVMEEKTEETDVSIEYELEKDLAEEPSVDDAPP